MRALVVAFLLPLAAQALFFGNSCGCQSPCSPCPAAPVCPPPPTCGGPPPPPVLAGPAPGGYVQAQPQYMMVAIPAQQFAGAYAAQPQYGAAAAAQSAPQEEAVGQEAELAEPAAETAGESADTQNTVYDDIVNAAGTAAEEYGAVATQTRRVRRYRQVRRAPPANFDPKCNSEALKTIIHQNIGDSTSTSKRAIQRVASEEIGGHVDVICSTGTFSYIVNTETYCETEKDGITCFAFRQSN